jgi:ElaB/YqjD/DUF883 family membrane-anchored ribosome-binding protein
VNSDELRKDANMASPQKNLEDAASDVVEPLAEQIAALRADLAELGTVVAKVGKQRARGLKSAASATAHEGYAKGEEALDVVMSELQSLEDELAAATRRRPFASLGIAALFGFLFGVLFRR